MKNNIKNNKIKLERNNNKKNINVNTSKKMLVMELQKKIKKEEPLVMVLQESKEKIKGFYRVAIEH